MNSREELLDALSGKTRDTSPPAIFTQTGTTGQMERCDSKWPEALFEAEAMADLSAQLNRQYSFATAKVPFCITVEAEALGAVLDKAAWDRQPAVVASPYRDKEGIPEVPVLPSPSEYAQTGRVPIVRRAAEILRKNEELFTIGGCVDPATAAMQLLGADDYLFGSMMEPESCHNWIAALTPLLCEEARQLSKIVDDVQIIAMGDANLTPLSEFSTVVEKPVKSIVRSIKSFSTIHSCGETSPILERLSSLGEDGLSVETGADPEGIFRTVSRHAIPIGGIAPVKTLLLGTEKDVSDSAKKYSEIGYPIIAPECGVPPNTPDSNLLALSQYRLC